jgi:Holliday junction DNA helicase RuvA
MIATLSGRLAHKFSDSVIIDVNGVGYEVAIPLSTLCALPSVGSNVLLNVHTALKEDAIELYGFLTAEEKELFKLLISVTNVGPKLARNILSGISVADFIKAVMDNNLALLTAVPGIGKKTAERLVLELREKALKLSASIKEGKGAVSNEFTGAEDDVVSALVNLGYREAVAREAVKNASKGESVKADFEALLKESLKAVSSR